MHTIHDTSQGQDLALLTDQWRGICMAQYVITRCVQVGNHHMLLEAMSADRLQRIAIKVPLEQGDEERIICERLALEELSEVALVPRYVMHGRCEDARPLLAMEWISGSSLAQQLRLRQTLTRHDYFDFMLQLAAGLSEIHARGFATNTLHATNVIVELGCVRLVDLGRVTHVREPRHANSKDPRQEEIVAFGHLMRLALGEDASKPGTFRCGEPVPARLDRLLGRCERGELSMYEIARQLKQMHEQCQSDPSTAVDEEQDVSAPHDTGIFERETTRLNAHHPRESVELLRQTHQETTRPRQRAMLLDAHARERLRHRFARHHERDED